MIATINNVPSTSVQEYISYGWLLSIYVAGEGDSMPFRLKAGATFYLDNDENAFGSVEVDVLNLDASVEIEVSEVITQYINKGDITGDVGLLYDNIGKIHIKPYIKTKELNGRWVTTYNEAGGKTFYMMRGINSSHYTDNNTTPTQPESSSVFNDTGNSKVNLPLYNYKNVYFRMRSNSKYAITVDIQYDDYGIDSNTGLEVFGGTSNFGPYSWSLESDTIQIRLAPEYDANGYTPSRSVITVTETRDAIPYVYTMDVEYECNNNDFVFDLLYLDTNFMWESIAFYAKNEVYFTSQSTTMETYDRAKYDINYRHRQRYDVTSDYLTANEADDALLFGLAQAFKIAYPARQWSLNSVIDARLLSKSVSAQSNTNTPMVQIEAAIEVSNQIKIA